MRDSLTTRLLLLLGAVACFLASAQVQPMATALRERHNLTSRSGEEGVPPEYALTSAMLGGFRGMFIAALWVRAQNMKQDGKFYEMVDIYNIITKLQPNHHMAWAFMAWDLAYNVSVEFDDIEDRPFWVFRGIDLLRRQGIPLNSKVPELYQELSWILYHKVGGDMDYAHPLYRRELAMQMERILRGVPPERADLLGEAAEVFRNYPTRELFLAAEEYRAAAAHLEQQGYPVFSSMDKLLSAEPESEAGKLMQDEALRTVARRASLWLVAHDLREVAGLDVETMLKMSERYGPIDWRTPYAHSLYWADQGYRVWQGLKERELTLKYERLVYFSLINLIQRGKPLMTPDGYVHYVPDYRLLDGVIKHMDDMVAYFRENKRPDGTTLPLTGVMSGYTNFLRDAVFYAYFDDRTEQAARMLQKLREVSKDEKYEVSLQAFVLREFAEWIDSPDIQTSNQFAYQQVQQAMVALATGDMEGYRRAKQLGEFFYKAYAGKRWEVKPKSDPKDVDYRNHIAPLDVLRLGAAMDLFGNPQIAEWMKNALAARLQQYEPELWQRIQFEFRRQQAQQKSTMGAGAAPAPVNP